MKLPMNLLGKTKYGYPYCYCYHNNRRNTYGLIVDLNAWRNLGCLLTKLSRTLTSDGYKFNYKTIWRAPDVALASLQLNNDKLEVHQR